MRGRNVSVIGVGMSRFGLFPEKGFRELSAECIRDLIRDTKFPIANVQAAYCGNFGIWGMLGGQSGTPGQLVLHEAGINRIPVMRIENGCASGSTAFFQGVQSVAAGYYDFVLVLGIEKMSGAKTDEVLNAMAGGSDYELEGSMGATFPGIFGIIANRHAYEYGTTREQMAMVSKKNHDHGVLNDKAMFQKSFSIEEILSSRMISDPLSLFECSSFTDGAAAVLLAPSEVAGRYCERPVRVLSSNLVTGQYGEKQSLTSFLPTSWAAEKSYREAGVGPEDIDLAEVHDCFSIAEILHYEDLGLCSKGEGGRFVESGEASFGGKVVVNPSGGLLSKGHPLGATGVAQVVEVVEQLRGECGKRQVEDARIGLTHCLGGFFHGDVASAVVSIFGGN